jgi:putative ABC transport system permease protein
MLRTGAQELLIGIGASKLLGLRVGDRVLLPGGYWPIVGVFSNGGDFAEGTFFADAETLRSAAKRPGFSSVIVRLSKPDSFDELREWIVHNPALATDVERVSDYHLRGASRQLAFLSRATYVMGAFFGVMKIMYAAVRMRTREIGTLRALGFCSFGVSVSVLFEAMLLALMGAALGALLAWLAFDGRLVYSGGVFRLRVSPSLVILGVAWAAGVALLGGLLPALRAGNLQAAQALVAV